MFKLDLEKAEELEITLPTSVGSWRKIEYSRKTCTSASLTALKPLTVWIATNCRKFFKKMAIPDHLSCLLRNLSAGQEATVRTGHGTMNWFQIGKGVHQGCILSPCLFNLCAESVQFSCSVVSDSLQPHESQHARPPCPSPTPGVHSDICRVHHVKYQTG